MWRRDLGGEFLTVLGVIGTLALALTFGLLLVISGSRNSLQTTPAAAVTVSLSPGAPITGTTISAEASPSPTFTASDLPATDRATVGASVTASSTASVTAWQTFTVTSVSSPAVTSKAVSTATIAASATSSPRARVTIITVTPTAGITQTAKPSMTPSAGVTSITTTPKPSHTPSKAPSKTSTPTATRTPSAVASITPSPTRTFTRTATATFTRTLSPTLTPSRTPTITPTFTPSATPTEAISIIFVTPQPTTPAPVIIVTLAPPTITPCPIPAGWRPYTVQAGDNLLTLTARSGVPAATFLNANCLPLTGSIRVGTQVFVPPAFFAPTAIPQPSQPAQLPIEPILSGVNVKGCESQGAQLFTPKPGSTVRGELTVLGSAEIASFAFYKLELSPENAAQLWNVGTVNYPVRSGVLGKVNLTIFAPGVYWLTLTVVDQTSSYLPPCSIRFAIGH